MEYPCWVEILADIIDLLKNLLWEIAILKGFESWIIKHQIIFEKNNKRMVWNKGM